MMNYKGLNHNFYTSFLLISPPTNFEAHICRKVLMPVYENGAVVKGIKQWPPPPKTLKL
jgi:hypothetical protein